MESASITRMRALTFSLSTKLPFPGEELVSQLQGEPDRQEISYDGEPVEVGEDGEDEECDTCPPEPSRSRQDVIHSPFIDRDDEN